MSEKKEIIVALAGNPNCGKTSLFNELVGGNQKVGNWAGVTIEMFEGIVAHKGYKITIVDLPGTYSLTPFSPEEVIARNFIIEQNPDIVVDVIDGTSLERNLYLTVQLMELQTNLVVALNMFDEVERKGIKIDIKQLQILLGSHVIPTSAVKKFGIQSLLDHIVRIYEQDIIIAKNKLSFSEKIEEQIAIIKKYLQTVPLLTERYCPRWLAIKLLESDQEIYKLVKEYPIWIKIEKVLIDAHVKREKEGDDDLELAITEGRNAFIRGALQETVIFPVINKKSITEIIDSILINRILGLPLFLVIMWLVFQFTFKFGKLPMLWIESFFDVLAQFTSSILPVGIWQSILVDGIIAGVGGVLVFLPNILLLFIALSFLEGTGYMARAAFVIDKIMHIVGLHGKSFLPMITGFGCSVPAILATRTLKSNADRLVTMMIIPFMSCGAKLPVYILLISAFFPPEMAGNVLFGVYLFGILVAILSAKLFKACFFKGESEPFVMELPPYRMPAFKSILLQTKFKAEMYIKKAGTIILLASLFIWIMSNYPHNNKLENDFKQRREIIASTQDIEEEKKAYLLNLLQKQEASIQLEYSFSGKFGKLIEPLISPLGFDWRVGVALFSGLMAKEVVVSTLSTIYSLGEVHHSSDELAKRLHADPKFTRATAISLIVFVLLYIPCLATLSVFRIESGSWKWVGIYSAYALTVAWIASFIVYRLSILLGF